MRVALVGIALPPIMGGLEVHLWELSKHLVKSGHDTHLYGVRRYKGKKYPASEYRDGVHIHRVWGTITLGRFEFYELAHIVIGFRILRLHRAARVNLAHAHTVYPAGIACFLARIISGIPFVVTSHGDEIMEFGRNRLYGALKRKFIAKVFSKASQVIAVSEELRQLSIRFGSDDAKTIRLANVIDGSKFEHREANSDVRNRLGIARDAIVVVSLRRLAVKNGVQYLVEAAPRIIGANSRVRFLVCGDGELSTTLQHRVHELGVADRFVFVGTVPNDEVHHYLAVSDIAVFPSLAEATSIACLEAMAQGLPVVASDVGGLPEIVDDGVTGRLVKFRLHASTFRDPGLSSDVVQSLADAVIELAGDSRLRLQMGKKGRERVLRDHSWGAYVPQLERLYKKALHG